MFRTRTCSCRAIFSTDFRWLKHERSAKALKSRHFGGDEVEFARKLRETKLMMGGRSWDDWIEEYSHSHENKINRLMHSFGIPMIAISILLIPFCFFVSGLWMVALGLFIV